MYFIKKICLMTFMTCRTSVSKDVFTFDRTEEREMSFTLIDRIIGFVHFIFCVLFLPFAYTLHVKLEENIIIIWQSCDWLA